MKKLYNGAVKVTSVEPQKKNPHRFNIFLDGVFAFGADEDLVVDKRLVVGKELTTSDVEQLLKDAEVGKLMERMYRLFSVRQRTEKEVRDYLKNLSFKRKVKGQEELSFYIFDAIVQSLKRKGLLNDEQFAFSWFESRSKKHGPNRIKQELFQKGIGREIIEEVISEQVTVDSEIQVAEKLLEKKMRIWKNLQPLEFKKKAYDFLMRRGFDYEIIRDLIEKYIKEEYN